MKCSQVIGFACLAVAACFPEPSVVRGQYDQFHHLPSPPEAWQPPLHGPDESTARLCSAEVVYVEGMECASARPPAGPSLPAPEPIPSSRVEPPVQVSAETVYVEAMEREPARPPTGPSETPPEPFPKLRVEPALQGSMEVPSSPHLTTGSIEGLSATGGGNRAEGESVFHMISNTYPAMLSEDLAQPEGFAETNANLQEEIPAEYGHCQECSSTGCVPGWLLFASMETTFLWPDQDGVRSEVVVGNPNRSYQAAVDGGLHLSPRFTLGLDHGHWGVQGRVWYQSGGDHRAEVFQPGSLAPGVIQGCGVNAYTVDVEAYRRFCCTDGWTFDLGFGFRYASLKDVGHVTVTQADAEIPNVLSYANATAIAEAHGPGITLFFAGDRPIHLSCCSCLKWFWRAQGSVTWGGITSAAQSTVMVSSRDPVAQASRLDAAAARTEDEMFITSFRTGVSWEHALMCLPGVAFVDLAFEYQWWDADGGVAGTESIGSVGPNYARAVAVAGPDLEMSLVGFTLGAGLRW